MRARATWVRRIGVTSIALMLAAGAVHAQSRGGGGGRGGRGGGNSNPSPSPSTSSGQNGAPGRPETPTNKADIIGVVQALGPGDDRVTIAYDAADALNWPAGTMSFVVAETGLLKGVTVGEKVRFHVDSQQVSYIAPVDTAAQAAAASASPPAQMSPSSFR